ncbi:MAG: type II toxin-antitoxin system RelE/ParE family toxin [Acidobacteria bacterium]|nr:type II toxin-antitoxin system RelE/ParE family toxin [Acidobacteriota bacterium]
MNFLLHPEAEDEFNEAIDFYDACEDGLGTSFAVNIFLAIDRILAFPSSYPIVGNNIRRCLCNKFPHSIIYEVHNQQVMILAIAHQSRKPNYWEERRSS